MVDHTDPGFDPTVQPFEPAEETDPRGMQPDRSEYNCPPCVGSGLMNDRQVCSRCQGTGKV